MNNFLRSLKSMLKTYFEALNDKKKKKTKNI